jgi:SSS family solute:Na+ symporter
MLNTIDLVVLVCYLATVVGFGFWFARSSGETDEFMAAGRSLPGWAIGLSMFGSYISSISFLANPGNAYAGNWNRFVFSLATPIAAAIAVRWFVPFYRTTNEISAYEHLEHRFGQWARAYAVVCFLLTQIARMGTVVYLLALAVAPLTGWRVESTILLTGTLMTVYTLCGGIRAVVWVGVLQSFVLLAGPAICILVLVSKAPGGLAGIIETGAAEGKFSLGSFGASLAEPTFWVVFIYGLVINVGNFAVDQSYVQRYMTARSNREAAKGVWITALLYVPVAGVFFFIGTALFVFYAARPELLGSVTKADQVFPRFIATQMPLGCAGLVVAAIFAASMDSNLNSMATLTLCDLYKRYLRPTAGECESMNVLRLSTFAWGVICTGAALAMTQVASVLDAWWELAGIFSGGVLGLFLLGMISRAGNAAALCGVLIGVLVIVWMTLSPTDRWPESLWRLINPMHSFMTTVVGTLVILLVGLLLSSWRGKPAKNRAPPVLTTDH